MNKTMIKMALDVVITIIFILLMDVFLTGLLLHEILGLAIFGLFFIHKLLNWSWIKGITKRFFDKNIKAKTKVMYVLDILLVIGISVTTLSGILISVELFPFLASDDSIFWTNLHISFSYISFIIISLHIGFHWEMILNFFKKMFKLKEPLKARRLILRAIVAVIALLGIKSSVDNGVIDKIALPLTLAPNEDKLTYSSKTNQTASLQNGITLQNLSTSTTNDDGLNKYLSNLICTACPKRCPLLYPRCGRGVQQAQRAKAQYAATQNKTSSSSSSSKSSSSSPSSSSSSSSSSSKSNSSSAVATVIESTSTDANAFSTFSNFLPIMGLFIGSTYYTLEFIKKIK